MRALNQQRQKAPSDDLLDFLPYEEEEEFEQPSKHRSGRSRRGTGVWGVLAFLFTVAVSSFAGVHLGAEMARQTVDLVPGWEKRVEKPFAEKETAQAPVAQEQEEVVQAAPQVEEVEETEVAEEVSEPQVAPAMAVPTREETSNHRNLEVKAKLLNIRGGPDTGAPLLSQANAGEVLQATKKIAVKNPQHPCWYEVRLNTGRTGFVACEFVENAGEL